MLPPGFLCFPFFSRTALPLTPQSYLLLKGMRVPSAPELGDYESGRVMALGQEKTTLENSTGVVMCRFCSKNISLVSNIGTLNLCTPKACVIVLMKWT